MRSLHPTPPQIIMLSDIFFSRVDPLFKVLHRPTVKKLMSAAADSMDHIDTGGGQEALMFAIYFAAITSLSQDECLRYFHQDREALAAHYKHAIEVALTNADFLNSMDLVTLQAFVIYLVSRLWHCMNGKLLVVALPPPPMLQNHASSNIVQFRLATNRSL